MRSVCQSRYPPFCSSKPPMSHASFGPTGSPLWLQNLADTETFRPILQSEIPPEWHRVDARQLAEAKRTFGLPEDQPVRAVTCIELPDRQPFWGLRTVGEPARTPEPGASHGGLLGLISRRRPSSPGWSKRKLTPPLANRAPCASPVEGLCAWR